MNFKTANRMVKNRVYIRFISFFLLFSHFVFLFSCGKLPEKASGASDGLRIDSLERIAMDSIYRNPRYAHSMLDEALGLAEDSFQYYKSLTVKSQVYFANSVYDSGFVLRRAVLEYCDRVPMSPGIHGLLGILENTVGNYYSFLDKTDSALLCYSRAYQEIRQSEMEHKIPDICINIADIYARKGAYDQRARYFRQALFVSDSLGIMDRMSFPIYLGLGETYMELRDFDLSDHFYRLAEKELDSRNLSEKFAFCNSRGNYYYYKKEYAKALPWFLRAREVARPTRMDFYTNVCEINLGEIYLCLGQLDSARLYLEKGFKYFHTYNNKTALYHLTTLKASLALKEGNPGLAYQLSRSYTDTVGIDPKMIAIRNKNLQDYFAATGDFKRAYEYQTENSVIENNIRSERTRMRVAEIDMRYRQDTTLLKREVIIRQQAGRMEYLEMTRWIWILLFVILLIVSGMVYYYMKRKRRAQWLSHIDQVTKLKMESIRNRVSPHFIFNVLNREICSEEEGSSRRTQLSGLVELLRSSLEITEKLSVTLAEELRFVRTYLNLQTQGLEPDFHLEWDIDPSLARDEIYIPAMLIQIPVENAVKHGLRTIEGEKHLSVFAGRKDKGILIRIEDNGPGYLPLSDLGHANGTGTGVKVLYRTIQLLNMRNKEKITYSVREKNGVEGTGTIVTFFIPSNYNYTL
ncbi:histidine kinase [uncultured Parabacteroides sp.]|uniref:histidine kinase n=1 Tax=uncultured Parabacteroides sp. TaxID=512312 RepID=UPI00343DE21E